MKIERVDLYRVEVPLITPYILSLGSLSSIETIVAELYTDDGRRGVGDATIVPGYTDETREGGWARCRHLAQGLIGCDESAATALMDPFRLQESHAVSVLQVAMEMALANPLLASPSMPVRVPILGAINTKDHDALPAEIEGLLAQGYRTLKVKVGWDVDSDFERLALIRRVNAGRAKLRVDANQGFSRAQGIRFATQVEAGDDLQLFEQPCDKADWDSNAAVAAVSNVPVMLDESIYGPADIERAAAVEGCGFVKLKISKLTGVDYLADGLHRLRQLGITPILGNGAASDIGCYVEACIARTTVDLAGENNGFLKNRMQLLKQPLRFERGDIVLEPGASTELAPGVMRELGAVHEHYGYAAVRVSAGVVGC